MKLEKESLMSKEEKLVKSSEWHGSQESMCWKRKSRKNIIESSRRMKRKVCFWFDSTEVSDLDKHSLVEWKRKPHENRLNGMWKVGIVGVNDIKQFCRKREQELGQYLEVIVASEVGFHVCFVKWKILEYLFIKMIWEGQWSYSRKGMGVGLTLYSAKLSALKIASKNIALLKTRNQYFFHTFKKFY